jgi:hypothetical protein
MDQQLMIRYLGDGTSFLNGIPARDLTEDEFRSLDNVQRAAVRDSPLYGYQAYRDERDAPTAQTTEQRDNAPAIRTALQGEAAADQLTVKGGDAGGPPPKAK